MAKRIIIDGAPGSGKTTILFGRTKDDPEGLERDSVLKRGFKVYYETGPKVMEQVMKEKKNIDKEWIFEKITEEEVKKNKLMKKEKNMCFCDRSLLGFIPIATIHSNQSLSDYFFEQCRKMKYDNPVFILEPISSLDLSKPIQGHSIRRIFTLEERKQIHNTLVAIYKLMGYRVIVVPEKPSGKDDINEDIRLRLDIIFNALK